MFIMNQEVTSSKQHTKLCLNPVFDPLWLLIKFFNEQILYGQLDIIFCCFLSTWYVLAKEAHSDSGCGAIHLK